MVDSSTSSTAAAPANVEQAYRGLLAAAVRAPSGDNTQPWKFAVDCQRLEIKVAVDPTRDQSPMNAGQQMARIAVGAAVENIVQTAQANGCREVTVVTQGADALVVRLDRWPDAPLQVPDAIEQRVTNRRAYDARPLPDGLLERLEAQIAPPGNAPRLIWIGERMRIGQMAEIIAQADALLFGCHTMRAAFLNNVRFDSPDQALVEEGLSIASLELAGAERSAFRLLPRLPAWLLNLAGIGRTFARNTKRLVQSASGLVLGVAADWQPQTDFAVGRLMQETWLTLTREGLAAQPMMSLAVLNNTMFNGDAPLKQSFRPGAVSLLIGQLNKLVPQTGGQRPAFLLRFGWAPPPSGRTGRRLPAELVT